MHACAAPAALLALPQPPTTTHPSPAPSSQFLPKDWIMEKWEEGYYITAMAGSATGSSLVVMSKGTPYTQQSYKVSGEARSKGGWRDRQEGHAGGGRQERKGRRLHPLHEGWLEAAAAHSRPWRTANPALLSPSPPPADSFPFKWINKKWKEGFFGEGPRCRGCGSAPACARQRLGW